jgi:hypothetical protein
VLDEARFVVWGAVAAVVVTIVGSGVAVVTGGSGCEMRGWEACWGAMAQPGSECRRLRGAGSRFGAGEGVVVVVDDIVGVIDGGCAAVVSGDVAHRGGDGGLWAVSSRGAVCTKVSAFHLHLRIDPNLLELCLSLLTLVWAVSHLPTLSFSRSSSFLALFQPFLMSLSSPLF